VNLFRKKKTLEPYFEKENLQALGKQISTLRTQMFLNDPKQIVFFQFHTQRRKILNNDGNKPVTP